MPPCSLAPIVKDRSYGIIPLKKENSEWWNLLIRHLNGDFWAFPKGHAENSESALEAAVRELKEETGLEVVKLLSEDSLQEQYFFQEKKTKIHKTVIYFLAEVTGEVIPLPSEIAECRWVRLTESSQIATFPECKALCRQTLEYLSK